MASESVSFSDDFLLEDQVLHLLVDASRSDDRDVLNVWLNNGCRLQSRLFEVPLKKPCESSKDALKSRKATRPLELSFLLSLSSTLCIDELECDILLQEYCKQQVLLSRDSTSGTLDFESFLVFENVRDYHYTQQQLLWKILQELLRIEKDEEHNCCFLARTNITHLMEKKLLNTLLVRISNLQDWVVTTPMKSQLTAFRGSAPPFALLDTRCSDFMGHHMLASAEFASNELERALETLILLLYTRANLNQLQLENLMIKAGRDSYAAPRGCLQLTQSILGQNEVPSASPFLVRQNNGLHSTHTMYYELGARLYMKYMVVFAESLQFWRSLQPAGIWEEREAHPLLDNYVQQDTERFTASLINQFDLLSNKSSDESKTVHSVALFLWGLFLEMFGNSARAENVLRPQDFSLWACGTRSLSQNDSSSGRNEIIPPSRGGTAEKILLKTVDIAVGGLVTIFGRVTGSALIGSKEVEGSLGSSLGMFGSSASVNDTTGQRDSERDGRGDVVDLLLICTVMQESVNVIISAVCLAGGSIDQLMNVTLLVELTHRCHDDLCETFWNEWQGGRGSENDTLSSSRYPLCSLLRTLLEHTPHDPTYLLAILASLSCSSSKSLIVLEMLNQQTSMVTWAPVRDLMFMCREPSRNQRDTSGGESQWVDAATWRMSDAPIIGVSVISCPSSRSYSHQYGEGRESGGLRDILQPQQGAHGVICDASMSNKEEVLVRWRDPVLWWGVILDTVSHSPLAASAMISPQNNASPLDSASTGLVIKTSVTLNLLSTLMKRQKLLTGFYLESKSEQLVLHSVLIDIGRPNLFNILSQMNETVGRILSDTQAAYLRLTRDDVGLSRDDCAELITLMQAHCKNKMPQFAHDASLRSHASPSVSVGANSACCMVSDSIVTAVSVLSLGTGGLEQLKGRGSKGHSVRESFLLSAQHFLASYSSSSSTWAYAVSTSITNKFDSNGPGSYVEAMYRMVGETASGTMCGTESACSMAIEVISLQHALFQSFYDQYLQPSESVQEFLLSSLTYVTAVYIGLHHSPLGGDSLLFSNMRDAVVKKCLSVLHLVMCRTASPLIAVAAESNAVDDNYTDTGSGSRWRNTRDSIANLLLSKLTQDPRLMQSILKASTSISLRAVALTPPAREGLEMQKTAPQRVFKTAVKSRRSCTNVLPIDYSYAFSSLSSNSLDACLGTTVSAIEVLSLSLNMISKHRPEGLPLPLSLVFSRVERASDLPADAATSLESSTYFTLLCGLLQSTDRFAARSRQLAVRISAIRALIDVGLLTPPRISLPSDRQVSIATRIGASAVEELCVSLCTLLEMDNAQEDRKGAVAAFDLLLSLGRNQSDFLVSLLEVKIRRESGSEAVGDVADNRVGMLTTTVHSLLQHTKVLYKKHPLLLHKLLEFITVLWRSASSEPLLRAQALCLIQMDSKFFSHITLPLLSNLPEPPIGAINDSSGTATATALELSCSSAVHEILRAAIGGADVSEKLLDSKKGLRSQEKFTVEYCHCLLAHASSLQIVALERHGHLFSMDATVAKKANIEMCAFFCTATANNRFFAWLKAYMHVNINDNIGEEVARDAKNIGIDLSSMVHHDSHIAGTVVGSRTKFGSSYIYDANAMHDIVVSAFERGCLSLSDERASTSSLNAHMRLERKVHTLNLQWSVSDAQMVLLKSWKTFIQIFVLPGSSARQMAFRNLHDLNNVQTQGGAGGTDWTPPASPAAGSLSPAYDPATGSPGPVGSNFAGDRRSYELVHEISSQLVLAIPLASGTHNAGVGTEESEAAQTAISTGAARVVLEKCELLTSMLHHQLREVNLRTSDPKNSQVDSRHLGSSRLSPEKMKILLVNLTKCYKAVMNGLRDRPCSPLQSLTGVTNFKDSQRNSTPEQLRRSIQKQLFISLILTFRGLVQLDAAPLFSGGGGGQEDEGESASSSLSSSSLVKLHIFQLAHAVLQQESELVGVSSDIGPGSLFGIALRLMKCCLPLNIDKLSLSTSRAWRAEATRPIKGFSFTLISLLRTLSDLCVGANGPLYDHNYSLWGTCTMCGPRGSDIAPDPQGDKVTSTASLSCALSGVLDILHGVLSSGVQSTFDVMHSVNILKEFCALGVFRELQRVLLSQPLSRSASLMGYSSGTGEISDLVTAWERTVDIVTLLVTLSSPRRYADGTAQPSRQEEHTGDRERETVREVVFEGVTSFLDTYGPLLMLPLTQSFSIDDSGCSRLTLRRVQLCRSSTSLLFTITQQFRVWRAVLPALFDAAQTEMSRAASLFITLLTDVKEEDKDGSSRLTTADSTFRSELSERDLVSTPGGVFSSGVRTSSSSASSPPRVILGHIMAVCEDEFDSLSASKLKRRRGGTGDVFRKQEDRLTTMIKKRRSSIARGERQKKSGLKVTFDETDYFKSAPSLGLDASASASASASVETKTMDPSEHHTYPSDQINLTADFILKMDRELLSSLVSVLLFLKEIVPEGMEISHQSAGASVCVGGKVYYYSRGYEAATKSVVLMPGMVVAFLGEDGTKTDVRNLGGERNHFEVVFANGGREFDVSPDDAAYTHPPSMNYQRLVIPYPASESAEYSRSDDFLFTTRDGVVVSVAKDLVGRSETSKEIWTGKGLEIVNQSSLVPVTRCPQTSLKGEESCTTAHLLRILAYSTSKATHTRFAESSSPSSLSHPSIPASSIKAPSSTHMHIDSELETLSGLSSWLFLGEISHHAHTFVVRRASSCFSYIGGRPGMIEQLEYLKSFVTGDAEVLGPPEWLVSNEWKQYREQVLVSAEEVITRLRDYVPPPPSTPEAIPEEPRKGTKIGLRSKLHFVSTPEAL